MVFVSPYCNKQCQLERAHDLVMSFQRQKNYLADYHLNNLRYLRHLRHLRDKIIRTQILQITQIIIIRVHLCHLWDTDSRTAK